MKKLTTLLLIFISFITYSQVLPIDTTNKNLLLWLCPDTGLYDNNGNECDIGDEVYEWHDISGNGWIFDNNNSNRVPELDTVNCLKYVDFTPGDFLRNLIIDDSLNGLSSFTIYIVIKSDNINTNAGFIDSENPDGRDDNICLRYDSRGANTGRDDCLKTGMHGNNANHQVESQANTQTTERQVLTLAWEKGERLFLFINGSISDSSDWTFNNDISGCSRIILGKGPKDNGSNRGWNGKIGDIIFYKNRQSNDSISDISQSLPVELIDFHIETKEYVELYWSTVSEMNNDYFMIEKSINGIDFEEIGSINGHGNSNKRIDYKFIDYEPNNGVSYYRLKQIDYNGEYSYSKILSVNYNNFMFNIYPNPINKGEDLFIEFQETKEKVLVVVNDIYGREYYSKIYITHQNGFVMACDCMNKLSPGTYIIIATSLNSIYKKKLIIK